MRKILTKLLILSPVLLVIVFTAYILFKPGYIIFTDVTEALDANRISQKYFYSYSHDYGESLAEKARIPIFYAIYSVFKLTNLPADSYVKIKIPALMLATVFAYIQAFKYFIKANDVDKLKNNSNTILLSAAAGALFYLTNFWFSNRILHFYLFFSSVTIPILFVIYYIYLFSEQRSPRMLVFLSIFLAIFTPTPHTVLFEILILSTLTFVYLILPIQKGQKLNRIYPLSIFFILYLLLNAYWILPFLFSNSFPDAVWSMSITNLISRYAYIQNAINLTGYWLTENKEYFADINPILNLLQKIFSYLPLLLTLFTIFVLRKNKTLSLSILLLLVFVVFLSSATKLSNTSYFYLMFKSPIKFVGWLFREYDKFGIILAFIYSFAASLVIYTSIVKKKFRVLLTICLGIILIQSLFFFSKTVVKNYTPTKVPEEFFTVNKILEADDENFNTAWYPGVPNPYWLKTKEVKFVFANRISEKPSITTRSDLIYYLDYTLSQDNINEINVGKALDIIGVKYLIVRSDDSLFSTSNLIEYLDKQKTLNKVYSSKILSVYMNNEFHGLVKVYSSQLITNRGLDILKHLDTLNIDTKNTLINFTDNYTELGLPKRYDIINNQFIDFAINRFSDKFIFPADDVFEVENGNSDKWRKSSLKNLNHAEFSFFFENSGLYLSQLDYDRNIITARDGYELTNKNYRGAPIRLSFSKYPNVSMEKNNILYKSVPKDLVNFWNTIRSDRYKIDGMGALKLKFSTNIPNNLVPHFKLSFYDEVGDLIKIKFIYPDERNHIDSVVKIPDESVYFDFSIWALSYRPDDYSYSLNDLEISDATNNTQPITFAFGKNTGCYEQCQIYARLLNNHRGGKLELDIGKNKFQIDTKTLNDRFNWIKIGTAEEVKKPSEIVLKNIVGINSINTLVMLTKGEENLLKQQMLKLENEKETTESGKVSLRIKMTNEISPDKYVIETDGKTDSTVVIGFTKPYSKNWNLLSKKAVQVNGFINGWEIKYDEASQPNYTIKYKPQDYFYLGAVVSLTAFTTTVLYLFFASKRIKS